MLELLKLSMRITTNAFDAELLALISACKADLEIAGITVTDNDDVLIQRAVVLYVKGYFGFNEESEKYIKAYEFHKTALAIAGDYRQ
jgi:hypothetical protein